MHTLLQGGKPPRLKKRKSPRRKENKPCWPSTGLPPFRAISPSKKISWQNPLPSPPALTAHMHTRSQSAAPPPHTHTRPPPTHTLTLTHPASPPKTPPPARPPSCCLPPTSHCTLKVYFTTSCCTTRFYAVLHAFMLYWLGFLKMYCAMTSRTRLMPRGSATCGMRK